MKQITVMGRCGKWSMPQRTVLWSTACDCSHLYFCGLTWNHTHTHRDCPFQGQVFTRLMGNDTRDYCYDQ